jgi:hypothetical protein
MPTGIRGGATIAALTVVVASTLLIAAPAGAATQVGQTSPVTPGGCPSSTNIVQVTVTSGTSYEVPAPGVITSWSHMASSMGGSGRLQVWRPLGGPTFALVGRSELTAFAPAALNQLPVQIAVSAGDLLGFRVGPGGAGCDIPGGTGFFNRDASGSTDAEPGETRNLTMISGSRLNVSAILEPDCDGDGLGDETQDDLADCAAPETQLKKVPKDKVKTKKKRAKVTFEFTGTDARAIAGFECSLDGAAFASCSSPHTIKVKKGAHTFSVRATDAAGHVDGAPATDTWKVKRKKKKKQKR